MAHTNLRVCSLNVNGMRDHSKRAQLFTWFKAKKIDIVFLQETHCKSYSDSKLWEKEWGGKCFWSFGGSRSRGTCIMFRDGLPFKKHMFHYDAVGRLIVLDINLYGCSYHLLMCTCLTIMRNAYSGLMNYIGGLSGIKFLYWVATLIALRTQALTK